MGVSLKGRQYEENHSSGNHHCNNAVNRGIDRSRSEIAVRLCPQISGKQGPDRDEGQPRRCKLLALARGLGVSEEEVFACARGVRPTVNREAALGTFTRLHNKFLELNNDDKSAILTLIEMIEHEIDFRLFHGIQSGDQETDGSGTDTGGR